MTDPIAFDSTTARFALPLLYIGQAGKEAFVNEAFSRMDTLLHCAIEGERSAPPEESVDGEVWLVGNDASGEWDGCNTMLACRQGNGWLFTEPRDGLRVFDRSSGQHRMFFGSWRKASQPLELLGGTTVDLEARTAISNLVASLQAVGILPST